MTPLRRRDTSRLASHGRRISPSSCIASPSQRQSICRMRSRSAASRPSTTIRSMCSRRPSASTRSVSSRPETSRSPAAGRAVTSAPATSTVQAASGPRITAWPPLSRTLPMPTRSGPISTYWGSGKMPGPSAFIGGAVMSRSRSVARRERVSSRRHRLAMSTLTSIVGARRSTPSGGVARGSTCRSTSEIRPRHGRRCTAPTRAGCPSASESSASTRSRVNAGP